MVACAAAAPDSTGSRRRHGVGRPAAAGALRAWGQTEGRGLVDREASRGGGLNAGRRLGLRQHTQPAPMRIHLLERHFFMAE